MSHENIGGRMVDVPERIAALKRNGSGYPIPWFVSWIEGAPDFRVVDPQKIIDGIYFKLCWICGQKLGSHKAFVVGPMCALNRISSEPPSHVDCAEFAAKVCPFMVNPQLARRETKLPDNIKDAAGIHLKRNPGVALVWITKSYEPEQVPGGVLLKMGPPEDMLWYAEGRDATAEEIAASIESGLPALLEIAEKEAAERPSRRDAVKELRALHRRLMEMIPAMKTVRPRKVKKEEN